jgi:hypothetical protein
MPPTEKLISSYEVEMALISLGAGHQPMNLWLLIYIDTPRAKGKGRGRGNGRTSFSSAEVSSCNHKVIF